MSTTIDELKEEALVVEENKLPEPSLEDMATHDFQAMLPKAYEILEKFSGEKLKRVVMSLVEYPFERDKVHFSYPEERELFFVLTKLFDCKFVLMRAVMEMKKDEIDKLIKELDEKEKEKKDAI